MKQSIVDRLLADIEKARRASDYNRMDTAVGALSNELAGGGTTPDAYARAKMLYEQHMAAYQQAMALLQKSLDLAQQSAAEAQKAGDPVGALFTQMNISGLLLPALGKRKEGFALSQQVYKEAQALAATATDDKTRDRANRVAVNALFHQIRMIMEDNGSSVEVKILFALAEDNPLYQAFKGKPDWSDVKEIKDYFGGV